ncbi:MAG: hypothetical protein E3K32_08445 [wastewater metagenome]|nr:hypothetical protein [Candidatus Loosdrechtia aerotolerans]
MTNFRTLFGTEPAAIQKTCVVTPFLAPGILRGFGIQSLKKGKLYSTVNTGTFTLVKTGISTLLVGDAILYLEQTACQEIIYFGACGLSQKTEQLTVGSLVCPRECLSFESFTDVLFSYTDRITTMFPDQGLFHSFLENSPTQDIQPVRGMSMGSLKCEDFYRNFFIERGIEVIDTECSAFFSAAHYIQRKAIALLYITDVIGKNHFLESLKLQDKSHINNAIQTACKVIDTFCRQE